MSCQEIAIRLPPLCFSSHGPSSSAFPFRPLARRHHRPPVKRRTHSSLIQISKTQNTTVKILPAPQRSFDTRFTYISSGTTSQTDRESWLLRANWKSDLNAGWRLGLLGQVPVVDKTTFSPTGTDREFGIGDAAFQAALSHAIDQRWAFGFGARLVAPTAEDALGSGKWQIMPGFGVRYSFLDIGPDTYFVPVVRYAISFAGDPLRRNISEPQIAPTLNIGLPDQWFVNFYPSNDIRINFGDPISGQTGRLFLPLDVSVGRKVADNWTISLEASVPIVKDYPVYNFKTELRIVKQF